MSFVLVRPTAQHDPAKVTGATSQDGLTVEEPAPASANAGNLRLRCSGTALAAESIVLALSSGGYPAGYSATTATGASASGAAVRWYRSSESVTLTRGYTDTPALTSMLIPLTYSATMGATSTPRELPDGYLGLMTADTATNAITFWRISTSGTVSSSSVSYSAAGSTGRPEFAVLPSGRLISAGKTGGYIRSSYSDDNGATWSSFGLTYVSGAAEEVACLEVVGEDVVMISGTVAAGTATIRISRDGGATFASVATTTLENPRTCVLDGTVYVVSRSTTTLWAYRLLPGGGIGSGVNAQASCDKWGAVCARDDGTMWAFGWDTGTLQITGSVSADGGATWTVVPLQMNPAYSAGYGSEGYSSLSAGMWGSRMVVAGRVDSNGASDGGVHLLIYGEWSNIAQPVLPVGYCPIDYPNNMGWTKVDGGAGSTVTNTGPLRLVTAVANYSAYTAPLALWAPTAGGTGVVQWALRVNSGGSLAANNIRLALTIDDTANTQGLNIRFTTTGARCYDTTGAQVGLDLAVNMTGYVEFRAILSHDYPAAGGGQATIHYRTLGSELWTTWINAQTVTEQAGVVSTQVRFGTTTGAVTSTDWLYVATYDAALSSFRVPFIPEGRALSPAYDFRVASGINLGAYGTGGVSGDAYTLTTPYSYGAERVWTELRPSSRCQSSADGGNWELDLDASTTDLFHGDTIAVFATNFRTALWQMSSSSTFATTPISVSLDATLTTFTVSAAGVGYIEASGVNWRPGQWKSNGDSRRYFLDVAGTRYEITDNDERRVKVRGVDLSAASGTIAIFGDRMAARMPAHAAYRYARLYVGAQDTADGKYRVGTPILGDGFTPEQLYDYGFVDRLEPNVTTTDADSGSSLSYRRGPALSSLSIQWPPLDKLRIDAEDRIADFYRACEGSLTPIVLWRDTGDLSTLMLVQIRETLTRTNVRGEGADALTRIDQLVLREVW